MTKTQREYWNGIIDYINASQAVINDLLECDNDEDGAKEEREKRLKLLANKYILRKKPPQFDFSLFKSRKH